MDEFVVSLFAGGHPFWCVDEESRIRRRITADGPAALGGASAPEVKTTQLTPSTTVLELRWSSIEAGNAWHAGTQVVTMLERSFPEIVDSPFLRVEATLQTEFEAREGRWTKEVRTPR